jgi:hypothetical protein
VLHVLDTRWASEVASRPDEWQENRGLILEGGRQGSLRLLVRDGSVAHRTSYAIYTYVRELFLQGEAAVVGRQSLDSNNIFIS